MYMLINEGIIESEGSIADCILGAKYFTTRIAIEGNSKVVYTKGKYSKEYKYPTMYSLDYEDRDILNDCGKDLAHYYRLRLVKIDTR